MRFSYFIVALTTSALLAGCGGGGGSSSSVPLTPSATAVSGAPSAADEVAAQSRTISSIEPSGAHIVGYPQYAAAFAGVQGNSGSPADAVANAQAKTGLPFWTGSVVDPTTNQAFPFTMIGDDPTQPGNETEVIETTIIKLVFTFVDYPGVTMDPSQPATGDTQSVIKRTLNSPIFEKHGYSSGNTQYEDAYQRQSLWNMGASRPDYHILLDLENVKELDVLVPTRKAHLIQEPGGSTVALVGFGWFLNHIPKQILAMSRHTEFPIALTYNTFFYQGNVNNCCYLGYHDAVQKKSGGPIDTYAEAAYVAPGVFTQPIEDVNILGHEVGEWINDPLGENMTLPWAGGQVTAGTCSDFLEVGDPLTGTAYGPISVDGYAYHPQELAYFSWFFHQVPSISQDGAYSNGGTLTSPAAACSGTISDS